MAVLLVEKGKTFPVKYIRINMKRFLYKYVDKRFAKVLDCTVCSAFWLAIPSDLSVGLIHGRYFFWPISGIVALGLTWVIIQWLNALES